MTLAIGAMALGGIEGPVLFDAGFVFNMLGFVLALPFSWWVVSGWLENFAFRVPLTPVVFILIFILMQILTAALVFIMYATLAREVPRDSLSVE